MLATLAALVVSTSPALAARPIAAAVVLEAAKKKKKKSSGDKEAPAETSEGLDLTGSDTSSTPAPPPEAAPAETTPPEAAPTEPEKSAPAAWSVVTAHTVGQGANVLYGELGWPGIGAGYWRGLLEQLDVGARIGFNWAYEAQASILPGLKFQVQGKYLIFDNGKLALSVHLAPGVLLYFFRSGVQAGLTIPVGGTLSLPEFVPKLKLAVALEVPFWFLVNVGAAIPLMVGARAEYPLTDSLLAFAKIDPLGVTIWTNHAGPVYTFQGLVGVAFHL